MSITLPASLISSLQVGGVTQESDPNYAVTNLTADYTTNTLTFTLQAGTTSGANFAVGTIGTAYTFQLNGVTGAWRLVGSTLTGTISGVALTNLQTTFKGFRNSAETLAVNQNIWPGATQVAW